MIKRLGARLRQLSKRAVFLLAVLLYTACVVGFGVVYAAAGLLTVDGGRAGLGDALYFSVVNQATVGFGDVLPSSAGRAVAVMQIAVGLVWSAFVPALVVYRLLLPSDHDLQLGRHIVFDPRQRRFRVRVANRASGTASGVMVRAWLRRSDPLDPTGRIHFTVGIRSRIEAATRFPLLVADEPWYFLFDEAEERLGHAGDDVIGLHPAHVTPTSDLLVQIEMRLSLGVVAISRVFDRDNIVCGAIVDVQANEHGPLTWGNMDKVVLRRELIDGESACRACEFRPTCTLTGKVD